MRMFFGSKRVNPCPRSAEDRLMAEQCSDYINYIVTEETDSFNTFYSLQGRTGPTYRNLKSFEGRHEVQVQA